VGDWLVESLRLTLFPTPVPFESANWWPQLMGAPPQRTESAGSGAETKQMSDTGSKRTALAIVPMRVDWSVETAELEPGVMPTGIPDIGPFEAALQEFRDLAHRWFELPQCPAAKRLAIGGVFFHPEDNVEAAYRRLEDYTPIAIGPPPVSDFLYRINRPRGYVGIAGLGVNRLSQWSAAKFGQLRLQLQFGERGVVGDQAFVGNPTYYSRLLVDFNTVPDFRGEIPRQQLRPLFDQMLAWVTETATNGDVP